VSILVKLANKRINMKCIKCGKQIGKWEIWVNPFPTYGQSLKNEIRKCSHCGIIQFKYKPEGNENRPEWSKEDIDRATKIYWSCE